MMGYSQKDIVDTLHLGTSEALSITYGSMKTIPKSFASNVGLGLGLGITI